MEHSICRAYFYYLILTKMKNRFSLAIIIALGLLAVSCSADNEEMNTNSQKQNYELNSKKTDRIANSNTIPSTFAIEDGTLPPKKP